MRLAIVTAGLLAFAGAVDSAGTLPSRGVGLAVVRSSSAQPLLSASSLEVPSTQPGVPSTPSRLATDAGRRICDKFGSVEVAHGAYLVQNNDWGAADGQCVTTHGVPGFTVDSGEYSEGDGPAAYPSIMSGCWMGTCTSGTTLPVQIGRLTPITSSIRGHIPAGTRSNMTYSVWADTSPRTDGRNNKLELKIWLNETGGVVPTGERAASVTIGSARWEVWKGTEHGIHVITYLRVGYVESADNLPISEFVTNAVDQGVVSGSDYLTNIQAGFEPRGGGGGGPGLQLTDFEIVGTHTGPSSEPMSPPGSSGSPGPLPDGLAAMISALPTASASLGLRPPPSRTMAALPQNTTSPGTTTPAAADAGVSSPCPSAAISGNRPTSRSSGKPSTQPPSRPARPASDECSPPGPRSHRCDDCQGSGQPRPGAAPGALWSMTSGLEGFQSTPWNNQGAKDPVTAASPNVPGRRAVRFEVPGGGRRSEAQPEKSTFADGDHTFFGYSAYLDKNFATEADSWQVIWQLHDNGVNGSPPVALEIGDGRLWLATSGNDRDKDLGAVTPGTNVSVQLEVQFDTGGGFVSVWRDGTRILSNYRPPQGTTVDGGAYLKVGIYRDPSERKRSTLFLNDLKIGDSLASVSNLAGATAGPSDLPAAASPGTG